MLAGVGGNTVGEAKKNLTSSEAADWALYVKKYGQIAPQQRMIQGFATQAWALWSGLGVKVGGRKPAITDFLPRQQAPADAGIDDVFLLIKGLSKESDKK